MLGALCGFVYMILKRTDPIDLPAGRSRKFGLLSFLIPGESIGLILPVAILAHTEMAVQIRRLKVIPV